MKQNIAVQKKYTKYFKNIHLLHEPFFEYKSTVPPKRGMLNILQNKGMVQKNGKGLYSFEGVADNLLSKFDEAFIKIARKFKARQVAYPCSVDIDVLDKAGYLDNFLNIIEFISSQGGSNALRKKEIQKMSKREIESMLILVEIDKVPTIIK